MKKILLFIALVFIPMLTSAQDSHLTFKGIPIDGKINEFVDKLKNEGFTLKEIDGNIATLEGEFVNRKCEIYVISSRATNTVWKVSVYLPKETSWHSIESSYKSFKSSFAVKYGSNYKSFEFFKDPYYKGDGYEMQALRNEKCTYATYWETPQGAISVSMSEYEQIRFAYEDKINSDKDSQEKSVNIMNDI